MIISQRIDKYSLKTENSLFFHLKSFFKSIIEGNKYKVHFQPTVISSFKRTNMMLMVVLGHTEMLS